MRSRLAHVLHLIRRFFSVLTARPLTTEERARITAFVTSSDRELFFSQAVADQRHALETADKVSAALDGDRVAVRAALFHDVGKIHSGLGPVGRTLATVAGALRLPLSERYRSYRDHGPLGAADLERCGAEPLVVAFARSHPASAPPGFDRHVWGVLLDADDD